MMIKESIKDTFSNYEGSDIEACINLLDKFAHDISEYGNALGSMSKMFQQIYDTYTEGPANISDQFK